MAGLMITGFPIGRGAGTPAAAGTVFGSGYTLRRRKWIQLGTALLLLLMVA